MRSEQRITSRFGVSRPRIFAVSWSVKKRTMERSTRVRQSQSWSNSIDAIGSKNEKRANNRIPRHSARNLISNLAACCISVTPLSFQFPVAERVTRMLAALEACVPLLSDRIVNNSSTELIEAIRYQNYIFPLFIFLIGTRKPIGSF